MEEMKFPDRTDLVYVKTCKSIEYLNSLRAGKLYIGSIEYYQNHENEDEEERGDKFEGVIHRFPPNARFEYSHPLLGERIELKGITGEVLADNNDLKSRFAYCLTSIDDKVVKDKSEGKTKHIFDPRNAKFGSESLIIYSVREFIERVWNAAKQKNLNPKCHHIVYCDVGSLVGTLPESLWGFVKDKKYEYMNEVRIMVDRPSGEIGDHFVLDIGDISDISAMMKSCEVNAGKIELTG